MVKYTILEFWVSFFIVVRIACHPLFICFLVNTFLKILFSFQIIFMGTLESEQLFIGTIVIYSIYLSNRFHVIDHLNIIELK